MKKTITCIVPVIAMIFGITFLSCASAEGGSGIVAEGGGFVAESIAGVSLTEAINQTARACSHNPRLPEKGQN